LKFPLEYGQSFNDQKEKLSIKINRDEKSIPVNLIFEPYQSVLFKIDKKGGVSLIDIDFVPKTPVIIPRMKSGKERWEAQ